MARLQVKNKPSARNAVNKSPRKTSKRQAKVETRHVKHSIPAALRRIKKAARDTKAHKITYVLDTNVIMGAWDSLFKFEEHDVCLVGQVWKELDDHKTGHSTRSWNVRQAVRSVDRLLAGKTASEIEEGIVLTPPASIVNGKPHTGKLFFDFSQPKIPEGMDTSLSLDHPDDRIILICLTLKKQGKRVVLVSNDGSCRVKATIAGVDSEEYLSDTVGSIKGEEDVCPGFHTMPEDFLESAVIDCTTKDTRSRYKLKHPALKNVTANEFIVIPDTEPLRVISKSKTGIVMAETFNFLDLIKKMGIKPRNAEQEFALQLLLDTDLPAVSLAGRAGSGKTYLTLGAGIELMRQEVYKRIIFTRSTQGSDEDIGFLPGDEKEKLAPWMGALWDNIDSLLEGKKGDSKKYRDAIQVMSLNFMKGRSITDTLIIVDESQDLPPKALKMISTRVGEGSKIVFLGNVAQIDNPHLTEHTCGLSVFIRSLRESNLTGHVTLQSGVRSAFASLAEEEL